MPNQDELREVDQREASDCHRACIATIFGIPWEDAPATAPPPGYDEKKDRWWSQSNVINDWLAARGLVEWRIEAKPKDRPVLRRGMRIVGPEKRREPADFMWPFPMATYYIGSGVGPRGVEHSVVMHLGKIVHDPNPARDMTIDAITSIAVFVARLPAAAPPRTYTILVCPECGEQSDFSAMDAVHGAEARCYHHGLEEVTDEHGTYTRVKAGPMLEAVEVVPDAIRKAWEPQRPGYSREDFERDRKARVERNEDE